MYGDYWIPIPSFGRIYGALVLYLLFFGDIGQGRIGTLFGMLLHLQTTDQHDDIFGVFHS